MKKVRLLWDVVWARAQQMHAALPALHPAGGVAMTCPCGEPLLPTPDMVRAHYEVGHFDQWVEDELPPSIQSARQVIWAAMLQDPDFRRGYEDNVAGLLMDIQSTYGTKPDYRDPAVRNAAAQKIVEFLFKEDSVLEEPDPVAELEDLADFYAAKAAQARGGQPTVLWEKLKQVLDVPGDDLTRCAVCGWPLAETVQAGCMRANCSQRPPPDRLYAPERAAAELAACRSETQP